MSGPSKVIVLNPDPRASRQVQLGFEREGVPAVAGNGTPFPSDAGLVLVGGSDGASLEMLEKARKELAGAQLDIPVVFAGRGVQRHEAERAGADEVVLQPAYLRDVVTVGRLLRGIPAAHRAHLAGSLVETTGVYTLVRALSSLGRSAVLTLIRGLRRGEVRFYHGEVTSAQVGLIHGQAALHQLLLWTDARFDFHREDIVRRHQIPLSPDELFADAERFLEGVRDAAGNLSPATVLEQDVQRIHDHGKQIPTEVYGVLRMFDGHRVLADVLEDSPYRVFETLRVAQRALEAGLLRIAEAHRPRTTWRAMLSIEEWLVGDASDGVVDRTAAAFDSTPVSKPKSSRKKRRKKRPNTPAPIAPRAEIDWGALVPRIVGAEVGPLSGVVPAEEASGEIASREAPREKLEALMDTDKRTRIFPTDIGLEPSVVWNEQELARDAKDAEAWKLAEAEAKAKAEAEDKLREAAEAKAKADALEAARREAEAAAIAAERKLARVHERVELDRAWDAVEADFHGKQRTDGEDEVTTPRERVEAEIKARAEAEAGRVQAEIEAKVAAERAKAEAEAAERAQADAEAKARAAAEEQAKIEAEKARLDAEWAEAEAEAKARADAEAKAKADADEKARLDAEWAKAEVEAKARAEADAKAKADADEKARLDAEWAKAEAEAKARAEAEAKAQADADEKARLDAEWAKTEAETKARAEAEREQVARDASLAAMRAVASSVSATAPATTEPAILRDEAPEPAADEPSDGVVRHVSSIDTAPLSRRRPSDPPPPQDDLPTQAQGEITQPRLAAIRAEPEVSQPSILVADLAAVHSAVSAVAAKQADAAASTDVASPSRELLVSEVRRDAVAAFTDAEEAFFRAGQEKAEKAERKASAADSFDDLDEGYEPVGFWDRLLGRKQPTKKKR